MADIQSNIKFNIDTTDAMASIKALQAQISAFQTQMSKGSSAQAAEARNLQRTLLDNINATGKFDASLTTIRTTTESFTNSLEKNKLSMREYFRYSGGASKSFGRFFKQEFDTIGKVARERVKDLQTQYIQLGRDANGAMQAIKVRPLLLDLDSLATKQAIAAQKQALLNQLLKQGSTNLLNFGKNTQWAGRQLMVGFTIPLGIMGTAAAKSFMEMEAATIKFQRVYGDLSTTVQESDAMVGTIKELASEFTKYGVSFKDTMTLAADAAAMGKTGAALTQQVTETNRLAVLGNVEQAAALETTTSLMDAFAISAENLGEKINFLNAVENQTVTSIEDLTIAIPKAGPVIKQLGGDVEDLAFFLTAMREGGINASEGANALKSGLASLINPTQKASDFMARFGININQLVESNKGDVKGLVLDFADALKTLDPLNRARAIEQLFGKFQFARMSTLFQNVIAEGSQASKVLELTNATATELGMLAGRELGKLAESPMYKFQKAVADIQAQLAPVGEEFLKAVTPIIEFGTKILEWFNGLEAGTKQFIVNLVGIVGGIGPIFLMTFGLIANGAANIIKLFTLMKNGFNKLGGGSRDLATQTQYMTNEQVEAAAVAASLDQAHNRLRQTFTLEAGALDRLTAAYQRNAAASGIRPAGPVRKFANGGMVMGPGSGTSDSIPAMVSNGEFITSAKRTKQYLPLLQNIAAGKVPGYASPDGGSIVGGPDVKSYTNAVGLFTAGENYDLKAGKADAGSLGKNILARGGKVLSPILHEAATQMLIESGQRVSQANIRREIERNPELVAFVEKTSKTLGESISKIPGKIGDAAVGAEFKKAVAANADMLTPEQLSAVQRVQSQITTVEDPTKLRIRKSGRVDSIGRMGIFKRLASYKNKKRGYLQTAEGLSGTLSPEEELVLAHLTDPKSVPMSEYAKSENLTRSAQAMVQRGQQGVTQITKEGEIGKAVTVPTQQLRAKGMSFAERVKKAWNDAVANGFDKATKRNSPPQEAVDAGEDYGRALNSGAKSQVDDAKATGQALGNAVVGGASGTARRAQDPGGSTTPMIIAPDGRQSGGKRRVQVPGDLEARQAAEAAAMQTSGNALSGKTKKQMKAARRKVAYNQIKSGKRNIGGKISGGGFAAAGVSAVASMVAPPEMQGMIGTISTVLSVVGMFGNVIGKIVPLLLRFAGPIGLIISAITAVAWIFGELDKAAKEREKNEKALSNSLKASAETIQKSSEYFGFTAKERIGSNAGVIASNTQTSSSVVQDFIDKTEFKKTNAKQIDSFRRLNKIQAEIALNSYASDLSSMGYAEDAVQIMIDALIKESGKKDVSLEFKSINVGTKKGRIGQEKAFQQAIDEQLKKVNIEETTKEIPTAKPREVVPTKPGQVNLSGTGRTWVMSKEVNRSREEMRALYDAGKAVSSQFAALQEAYNDGTLSLEEYNQQFKNLTTRLKRIPNDANKFTIMRSAIRALSPEMANFTKNIKNSADMTRVLQAAMLGLAVPESVIADLDNLSTAIAGGATGWERRIAGEQTTAARKKLDKLIKDALSAQKLINDSFVTPTDTTDGGKGTGPTLEDKLRARLQLIEIQEDRINKKYDERRKALEEVKKVQEQISAQQRDQLDLADALTRGDIAAAAMAAQQMRANNATRAIEQQQVAMDAAQQKEVGALRDPQFGRSKQFLQDALQQLDIQELYKTLGMKAPAFGTPTVKVPAKTSASTSGAKTSTINNKTVNNSPVYNITVTTSSNASATDIANVVADKIKSVESQKIKGSRLE